MKINFSIKSVSVICLTFSSTLCAAPRLGLSTNNLATVNVATGTSAAAQTVQAFNLGDGSLNLSASTSASWLAASVGPKVACSQRGGSCYPVNITLNTSSLAAGTFTEYVTVTDPNAVDSPQDIVVRVNTTGVPGSIDAYVAPYGTNTANALFPVYTSGAGIQSSVTTQSGGSWLVFLSGVGIATFPSPFQLEVSARPGQAPGVYSGSVVLTGSSVPSDNKTINVTLNVTTAPIVDTNIAPVRVSGYPGGALQYSLATLYNAGSGTLAIASASSPSKFLSATVSGNALLIAADPTGLSPGVYNGVVNINSNAANNAQVAIPVEFVVAPVGQPLIFAGGIVNAATSTPEAVSQGDIVSIYGSQFAPAGTSAVNSALPLATTLGGAQVLVNGVPAPLYYVSPGQINFQVPYSAPTTQSATVQVISNGAPGNLRPMDVAASAPRLLYFVSFIQGNYGVVVNGSDNSLTLPSGTSVPGFVCHPAKPGDTIIVYGIGFGQTTPAAVEGVGAGSKPLQSLGSAVATLGGGFVISGQTVNAAFAGLTPTAVGLYQINVTIPPGVTLGNAIPLTVTAGGVQSNLVGLAISADGK